MGPPRFFAREKVSRAVIKFLRKHQCMTRPNIAGFVGGDDVLLDDGAGCITLDDCLDRVVAVCAVLCPLLWASWALPHVSLFSPMVAVMTIGFDSCESFGILLSLIFLDEFWFEAFLLTGPLAGVLLGLCNIFRVLSIVLHLEQVSEFNLRGGVMLRSSWSRGTSAKMVYTWI